jgi:hypothetical protein
VFAGTALTGGEPPAPEPTEGEFIAPEPIVGGLITTSPGCSVGLAAVFAVVLAACGETPSDVPSGPGVARSSLEALHPIAHERTASRRATAFSLEAGRRMVMEASRLGSAVKELLCCTRNVGILWGFLGSFCKAPTDASRTRRALDDCLHCSHACPSIL